MNRQTRTFIWGLIMLAFGTISFLRSFQFEADYITYLGRIGSSFIGLAGLAKIIKTTD